MIYFRASDHNQAMIFFAEAEELFHSDSQVQNTDTSDKRSQAVALLNDIL